MLPKEVEKIEFLAFQECTNITSITFSSSLQYIDDGAFGGNHNLTVIKLPEKNKNFQVKSNVLFSKDGEILYLYPTGLKNSSYNVPYGTRRIHPGAFMENKYLSSVYLPDTMSSIGIEAFENCSSLAKVKLSDGLLEIEAGAFLNCSKLKELNLPDGMLHMYDDATKGCSDALVVTLPESIQDYPDYGKIVREREEYITSAMTQAPESAVQGTGKVDTSWYDSKKKDFSIKNPDQLAGLAKLVNDGKSMEGKTFTLESDISLEKYPNWSPIGMWSEEKMPVFKGKFDGGNHTIYNLRIQSDSNEIGLFGIAEGEICNLIIQDADVVGRGDVGILCGLACVKKIENCTVSGRVRGQEYVGGMIGRGSGDITTCTANVTVKGVNSVGGIIGDGCGTISGCTSAGEVFGYDIAGGICGKNCGDILKCTNTAIVEGSQKVGGMIGDHSDDGKTKDCTNYGAIRGTEYIGGIAGVLSFNGSIEACMNSGDISGKYYIGGIAGENTIGKCIKNNNSGTVAGFSMVGGVIGFMDDRHNKEEKILNCKNTGTILAIRYFEEIIGKCEP